MSALQEHTIAQLKSQIVRLEIENEELREELDISDVIHYDEIKSANFYNFWLTGAVVVLALWIATG